MKTHNLALLPGDGIGPEVTAPARAVVEAAAQRFGFEVRWATFPYGADYYLKHGVTLPVSAFAEMASCDALLLGALGDPRVPPGPLEQEILLALRFHFDQYLNLRPARAYAGVRLPAPMPEGERLDYVVVRENTEDLYMGLGGRRGTGADGGIWRTDFAARRGHYVLDCATAFHLVPDTDAAFSFGFMTAEGVARITRKACRLTLARGEEVFRSVSKANAVPHLYGFWDEQVEAVVRAEFPALKVRRVNVDALCYQLARSPWGGGVLLCPNLFGDIVSDLLAGLSGGLGLAAAGNIGDGLSMFEPVHGSAPDIAGTGRANPLAAILSAAMMLRHLGEAEAADAVEQAVRDHLAQDGPARPRELGGDGSTAEVGARIVTRLLGVN